VDAGVVAAFDSLDLSFDAVTFLLLVISLILNG